MIAHLEVNGESVATSSYKLTVMEPVDADGDGLTDKEEVGGSSNPLDPNDPVAASKPIVDVTDIKGVLHVGQTLTGEYSFNANGGNTTDTSTMQWNNGGQTDTDAIYQRNASDVGRVLEFEMTAKNGAAVMGNTDRLDTANAPGVSGGGTTPPGSVIDPVAARQFTLSGSVK